MVLILGQAINSFLVEICWIAGRAERLLNVRYRVAVLVRVIGPSALEWRTGWKVLESFSTRLYPLDTLASPDAEVRQIRKNNLCDGLGRFLCSHVLHRIRDEIEPVT